MSSKTAAPLDEAPTLWNISRVCLKIGLLSFGGGLAGWLYQEFVTRRGWIEDDDFVTSLTISQMLPGVNVVNLVICLSSQLHGLIGALVAVTSFVIGPFFAVILLASVVQGVPQSGLVPWILSGVAGAASGMLLMLSWRGILRATKTDFTGPFVVAAVAISVAILKVPLFWAVVIASPLSIAIIWWRRRNDA